MRPQTALLAAAAATAAWLLYKKKKKRRVVITGCCGNLGRKLGAYLQERGVEVVGIEHPDYCAKGSEPPCDCVVQADAQQPLDRRVLAGADAVVHFSAVNPYPNASRPAWKSTRDLGDLREPPRHRADAATGTI